MKKLIFTSLFFLGFLTFTYAQKVNEKVQINSKGAWYPGKILKINADDHTYYVSYDGWDEGWNEWVTIDRLKDFAKEAPAQPLTKFKVGDRVEVEYGMVPEPATVIEENKYHIKYDKTVFKDKWVTEREIKKL